jgi:hypothetical protein
MNKLKEFGDTGEQDSCVDGTAARVHDGMMDLGVQGSGGGLPHSLTHGIADICYRICAQSTVLCKVVLCRRVRRRIDLPLGMISGTVSGGGWS